MAADHSLDYLARELAVSDAALGRDVDLLTGGLLDSMGVLRLATFVSEEFGIEIQPADFVIENFRSVSAIACYISRVRSRTGGPDGPARS
jgi:acyl carrier protein